MSSIIEIAKGTPNISLRIKFVDEDEAAIDISSYSNLRIVLTSPSLDTHVKNASFVSDGTDGLIASLTTATTFYRKGGWEIKGRVEVDGSDVDTEAGYAVVI